MKRITLLASATAYACVVALLALPVLGIDAPKAGDIIRVAQDNICRSAVADVACGAVVTSNEEEADEEPDKDGLQTPDSGAADDLRRSVEIEGEPTETAPDTHALIDELAAERFKDAGVVVRTAGSDDDVRSDEVSFVLRTVDDVVYEMDYVLPEEDDELLVEPTAGGDRVAVSERSALATLIALDALSDEFTITDLQHYESFESLFLNCIEVPSESDDPLCGNWQFVVNGDYPSVGLDKYELEEGDSFMLFFGSPRRVVLSADTITAGDTLTTTVEAFDADAGAYAPVTGYTVGVTQPNADNPFSPTEVATAEVNTDGQASFALDVEGEYGVGIQEDFYFPLESLSVLPAGTVVEDDTDTTSGTSFGSGGSLVDVDAFSVPAAQSFIAAQQEPDGSFGGDLFTDWAAIALAADDNEPEALVKVRRYLLNDTPSYSRATDFERRALALMVLGISPYDGTPVDYIDSLWGFYDGAQLGEPKYVNDDIFALMVFGKAGYTTDDARYNQLFIHVRDSQMANGSWEDDVDLTAAALQALALFEGPGTEAAMDAAEVYLRSKQDDDASWGNSFATSWVLQGIAALGQRPNDWETTANPLEYMAGIQGDDGGVDPEEEILQNRLWATSYAVPAVLGKTWPEMMSRFAVPVTETTGDEGGESSGASGGAVRDDDSDMQVPAVGATDEEVTPESAPSTGVETVVEPAAPADITTPAVGGPALRIEEYEAEAGQEPGTSPVVNDQLAAAAEAEAAGPFANFMRFLALAFTVALAGFVLSRVWKKAV